jgi:hypothetical protein
MGSVSRPLGRGVFYREKLRRDNRALGSLPYQTATVPENLNNRRNGRAFRRRCRVAIRFIDQPIQFFQQLRELSRIALRLNFLA